MNAHHPSIRRISECFVKPKSLPNESNQPYHLIPDEIAMLSLHYSQKGLLFRKPSNVNHDPLHLLHRLKNSLSIALFHFYPLSGRLATITHHGQQPSISIYVDCLNSPGAKFIHAALDIKISDVLSPVHVPSVVQSFFDLNRVVNYDGHTMPLLSIQVTELLDGVFIACCFNHAIADGTSYWHFINMWSEIFQTKNGDDNISISRPPVLKRCFPDGIGPMIKLPITHPDQFISQLKASELKKRIFHFSTEFITKLKAKTNAECGTKEISSFQSLSAFVWRSITRARRVPENQICSCSLAANNRGRLEPKLSENYFGNMITLVRAEAKAGELVERGVGWGAWKLHEVVVQNTSEKLKEKLEKWMQSPSTFQFGRFFDPYSVLMGSSPRFNIYGNEFGMGKAVALQSGQANMLDGKVSAYPGYEGGGSIDLEICLLPQYMANLESDFEFMSAISSPPHLSC